MIKDLEIRKSILDYTDESSRITWILKSRKLFPGLLRGRCDYRRMVRDIQPCWLWRWMKGPLKQGISVACRSWKKQGNRFFSRAPRKEHRLADTLILAQWDLCCTSNPQNYLGNKFVLFFATKICGNFYSHSRKLIHKWSKTHILNSCSAFKNTKIQNPKTF